MVALSTGLPGPIAGCLCLPTRLNSSGKPAETRICLLQALGLAADMSAGIMGKRTRRFAMYVNDGTVSSLFLNQTSGLRLHPAGLSLCLAETGEHHLLRDTSGCRSLKLVLEAEVKSSSASVQVECLNVETGEDGGGSSDKSTSAEALLKAMA